MRPDELRVCVTSGYRIGGKGETAEAEAIVYSTGGQTEARFILGGGARTEAEKRHQVARRAHAWIAADGATREAMQASEFANSHLRGERWKRWLS